MEFQMMRLIGNEVSFKVTHEEHQIAYKKFYDHFEGVW